ncbi:DUF6355 family natural product biosynthesis protein [Rhodococcus sp. KBW08]|uniref:DUF6355 family natural product biosynthesis protein n=1 Tax=Rhodococcus sp. KBW08 TaxID=2144188 RepID=UPI0037C93977
MAAAASDPCGYFERDGSAYWRNCANHGDRITVHTNYYPDPSRCVGAGYTDFIGLTGWWPATVYGASLTGSC